MRQKTNLFFSLAVNKQSQELPHDFAVKTMDALIAYNKSLMRRVLIGNSQEITKIMLSMWIELSEIPPLTDRSFIGDLKVFKKEFINNIISDIKEYEKIKSELDKGDLDCAYLCIYITHKLAVEKLRLTTDLTAIQFVLALHFPAEYAKKKSIEINSSIATRSNKCPLFAEYNTLGEVLKVLKPKVSLTCLRFLDHVEINFAGSMTAVKMSKYERNRLERNLLNFAKNDSGNTVLQDLIQNYFNCIKNKIIPSSSFHDNLLNLYGVMSKIYQLETQINEVLQADEMRKKNVKIINALAQNTSSTENTLSVIEPAFVASMEKNVIYATVSTALEEPTKTMTEKEQAPEASALEKPTKTMTEKEQAPEASALEEPTKAMTEKEQALEASALAEPTKEIKSQEQIEDESVYTYQPFYKKAEKPVQRLQSNTLQLKEDDKLTFLQVFGLISYDSINLRALVNLTLNFGAQIKTTGANRCRIEIKNIYAFITLPQKDLERACNSATITMHGGGHRSTRSQNHDREKAPSYLIEQFKDAFIRAGFTPVNLGLGIDDVSSRIIPSQSC